MQIRKQMGQISLHFLVKWVYHKMYFFQFKIFDINWPRLMDNIFYSTTTTWKPCYFTVLYCNFLSVEVLYTVYSESFCGPLHSDLLYTYSNESLWAHLRGLANIAKILFCYWFIPILYVFPPLYWGHYFQSLPLVI